VKFYCIADEDTARGFRLAGIVTRVAETAGQAQGAIDEISAQPDCGVIIITEKLAVLARSHIESIRLTSDRLLIVEIPGPEGPIPGRKGLRELVQEAVGVSVG
jgi:V/A-type H+/Na+-transporting ATPase subunit F